MVRDGNYTYGERIIMYIIVESLCCTHEISRMRYVNYISIKKKKDGGSNAQRNYLTCFKRQSWVNGRAPG